MNIYEYIAETNNVEDSSADKVPTIEKIGTAVKTVVMHGGKIYVEIRFGKSDG